METVKYKKFSIKGIGYMGGENIAGQVSTAGNGSIWGNNKVQ